MDNVALFRATMRAVALGNADEAIALEEQIGDADREAYHLHVTAMFAALVQHWFQDDSSHPVIVKFVNGLRQEYADANPPIRSLMIEGLIRVVFGEEHFLAEIPLGEQLRSQFLVIRTIIEESPDLVPQLDEVLDAAEELAGIWARA